MNKPYLLLLASAGVAGSALTSAAQNYEPYAFSTVAGVAPGSVDGSGTSARFNNPRGVAIDNAGNTYVTDEFNHTIRKITPAGVVSTFAGLPGVSGSVDGVGGAARFNQPRGIAIDAAGNLFVAESSSVIRKIASDGTVSTIAGRAFFSGSTDGAALQARFYSPSGLALDSAGNLYVGDTLNYTIRKITPAGVVSTLAGTPGGPGSTDGTGAAARFYEPDGVAVDGGGNVFVADFRNHTIRKVTPAGAVTTVAGLAGNRGTADGTGSAARFGFPEGVAVDGGGNVYVADTYSETIRRISTSGAVSTLAGFGNSQGSTDGSGSVARFREPKGVCVDAGGSIVIADTDNNTVRKVTSGGTVSTFAGRASTGSDDGAGNSARFNAPKHVARDAAGNLYVADAFNHTVRKISTTGSVSTLAGLAGTSGNSDGTGGNARFNTPYGIATDTSGNIFVADSGSNTIRKITATGVVSTFAGSAGVAGSADGTGSAARFTFPSGLTCDAAGNVYVADTSNHTVRKITPGAVVTTLAGAAGLNGSANGTGTTARFYFPEDVAADSAGNVYVTDSYNQTIRKIDGNGSVTTVAGSPLSSGSADGTGAGARFSYPRGLDVDGGGNVYVADSTNSAIRKITPGGVVTTLAGSFTRGNVDGVGKLVQFTTPWGIAVAPDGALYVADSGSNTVRVGVLAPPPPNDNFVNAQPIGNASGTLSAHNLTATIEAGEPNHAGYTGGHSVWYDWTAPQSGVFAFTADSTSFSTLLGIYTGPSVDNLTEVASGAFSTPARLRAIAGTVYHIAVDGYFGGTGSFTLSWQAAPPPPPNDDFANAQPISGNSGMVSGTNVDATKEPGEPNHANDTGGYSVWYDWTAPATGRFVFDASGSSFNALLGIYTGGSVDQLAGHARASFPPTAQFDAVAGVVYHIAVDGSFGESGSITLKWQPVTNQTGQSNYEPYAFSTLVGTAPGSVDGTGSASRFNAPFASALDSAGNAYIADANNHVIRKITPAGVVSTFAGLAGSSGSTDGVGALARFTYPEGIAVDAANNLFVADTGNNTIRKITPAALVSTIAGTPGIFGAVDGTGSSAVFDTPTGIVVDSAGNIYVTESNNNTVRKISAGNVVTTFAGSHTRAGSNDGTASAASFSFPAGITIDGAGNLYLCDYSNSTVRKITPGGVVSTFAGTAGNFGYVDGVGPAAQFAQPFGITLGSDGNLYVADTLNSSIRRITPGASVTTIAGSPINAPGYADGMGSGARFNSPEGISRDGTGNLYVADTGNSTVRKVTLAGDVTTVAGLASPGSEDGTGNAGRFYFPAGVAVDANGNVYIADSGNSTIRKVSANGTVTTLAGLAGTSGTADGTGSAARFRNPDGVAVDSQGNVFVGDRRTIRKITPAGVVTTFAGSPTQTGSADGTGSAARFSSDVDGLAIDSADNIYVADSGNQTVRKITPAGVVTTLAGSPLQGGSEDGVGSAARFNGLDSVAVDGAGNVYVADTSNGTIRKITPGGTVTTFAGSPGLAGSADGTGNAARLSFPWGVAVDDAGNVYVTDPGNSLIRKITPAGVVTTLGGLPGSRGSTDGIGGTARFNGPEGIAVSRDGTVYIGDASNNAVRIGVPSPVPVITSAQAASGNVGQAFSYQITATGNPTSFGASGLPAGLLINTATGLISGTPTVAGTFRVTVSATNQSGTGTALLVLSIAAQPIPAITSELSASARQGVSFSYQITATNSPSSFNATGLPAGLAIDPATGLISGTPSATGVFDVTISATNFGGTGSAHLTLTVAPPPADPPTITSPLTAIGTKGQQFTFQFFATGADSLGVSGLPRGLSFDPALAVISGVPAEIGTFQVTLTATNVHGTTRATLALTLQAPPRGPVITSSTSSTGKTGAYFSFQVLTTGASPAARISATGLPPGLAIDSVTGLISGTPTAEGSFVVKLLVTDGAATTSNALQLTFSSDPGLPVVTSPTRLMLTPGQPFTYTIIARGSGDPSDPTVFRLTGTLPEGLTFNPATGTISGVYGATSQSARAAAVESSGDLLANVQIFATNSHGTTITSLTFLLTPPGVANISTRVAIGTDANVLIGGFYIAGNAPKKVIIRARAPSLNVNGVPVAGTLSDPVLELHDGVKVIGSNDDWRSDQEQEIIASTVAPADNREPALIATLAPGAYTAVVHGKDGATGLGIVEVFDLGTASLDANGHARLVNLSTRGFVQTDNDVMIGGFIISGGTTKVIVRAIGPDLTRRGVAGALSDTILTLHDANGLVASNDDWKTDQAQEIIASTVPPNDDRESAIVADLKPGAYTAIVQGKNGSTGVGLVEVYVLP